MHHARISAVRVSLAAGVPYPIGGAGMDDQGQPVSARSINMNAQALLALRAVGGVMIIKHRLCPNAPTNLGVRGEGHQNHPP